MRLKIVIFISALMAAIGGLRADRRLTRHNQPALGWELDAIAAPCRRTSSRGYGTVLGTLIGRADIGVINTA